MKFGRQRAMTPARIEKYKELIEVDPGISKRQIVAALSAPDFCPPTISINSFYNWERNGFLGMETEDTDDL